MKIQSVNQSHPPFLTKISYSAVNCIKNKASNFFPPEEIFLCHNKHPVFSYNCVSLWKALAKAWQRKAKSNHLAKDSLQAPWITCHSHRPAHARSSLPFKNSISFMNVIDATTGTVWAPSPFTTIFPYYYRMLWEHLGNYPNSLLGWTLCPHAWEVDTQAIQPELEVLASFVISGFQSGL